MRACRTLSPRPYAIGQYRATSYRYPLRSDQRTGRSTTPNPAIVQINTTIAKARAKKNPALISCKMGIMAYLLLLRGSPIRSSAPADPSMDRLHFLKRSLT
jgi:hypothetical protein